MKQMLLKTRKALGERRPAKRQERILPKTFGIQRLYVLYK